MKSQKFSNLIQLNAESIGIKTLDNEIIEYLNSEIEEKIRLILFQSKKFMRISKRKTLKVDDLNHSLQFYNFTPLLGYDSYANTEYEKIENIKGLWKQKQNIIDIEEYINKPIAAYPMKPFPHFHWFSIEGKRPNISENFIREEYLQDNNKNDNNKIHEIKKDNNNNNILSNKDNNSSNNLNKNNNISSNNNLNKNTPIIHNLSKELQIFFDNFLQRFSKDVKMNNLNQQQNPNSNLKLSQELIASIKVISSSSGVVELLPYLINFLLKILIDTNINKVMHITIIYYAYAILQNEYFFIEPYLHQIIQLILSLILLDSEDDVYIDRTIKVKMYSIKLLQIIVDRFKIKYPNLPFLLFSTFNDYIENHKDNYLSFFAAIESIFMLGPSFSTKILKEKKEIIENKFSEININNIKIKDILNKIYLNDNIKFNNYSINIDNLDNNNDIDNVSNFDIVSDKDNSLLKKQLVIYYAYINYKKNLNSDDLFNII